MSFMSILSKEYADLLVKKNQLKDIDIFPIGTGPFIFKKYTRDLIIRFKRNDHYFEFIPKISDLIFSITPEPSVRFQKLRSGECHLIIEPSPTNLKTIETNPHLRVLSAPGLNISYLAFNTKKHPFDKVLVRKAISHALNKQSYIDAIYLKNAIIAKTPLPPNLWGYNEKIIDYSYNPEKAKALLKQAGYPNGFSTELWVLPISRPYNPNGKKMGEMMQFDLSQIGIKAKIITFDWPTYLSKSRKGEYSLIQMGWSSDNGDPDNFLGILLGCSSVKSGANVARWCNDEFDDLIKTSRKTSQKKKRIQLYKKAQEIFKANAPWVPLAHSTIFRALSKNVIGYKIDPLGGDIFKEVDLL
jgi:dipeptide transport system substrate-binding protein